MAKTAKHMTSKERLSWFRNKTKGLLMRQQDSIQNNILFNLPDGCKALSNDELELIQKIKATYNDLVSTWDYRTKELLNEVNSNL